MKRFISMVCCMVILILCLPSAYAETTSDTTKYNLNKAAQTAGTMIKGPDSVTIADSYVQIFQYGYIDYKVTVPSAATYLMDIYYCTKVDTLNLKINVNENTVFTAVPLANTNSYSANKTETLGKIDLKEGENTIRIQVLDKGSAAEWILVNYFTLTKIGDIFYYPMTVDTFTGEGASYNNGYAPAGFNSSQKAMDMRDVNGGADPTWAQKPITVTKSGWYGVSTLVGTYASFEFCIDAIILDADGNITSRLSSSIPHTGGMTTYENKYMGMIYLTEGTHTIKFMCTNGIAYVKSFTIGQVQDDLMQSAPLDFLVRKDTVDIDNFISSTESLNRISVQLTRNNSFKIHVYTEKALNYDLSLKCGTVQNGQNINVSVNGYEQIVNGSVNATSTDGSYVPKGKQTIGNIYLNRGFNEIEISRGSITSVPVFIERIYFDLADSFENGYLTVYAQENRVPEYSGTTFTTAANDKCVSVSEGTTLTYDIYTQEAQVVDVLADAVGGSEFVMSAAVSGVSQFSSASTSVAGKDTAYGTSDVLGTVNVPAGHSKLSFTINSGSGYLRSLLLEPSNISETQLLSFELQNAEGVRVPYSVSQGIDIYGAAEIKKVGDAADNVMLLVAEYDTEGKLVNTKTENISVLEMASREVKTFRTKLTLQGEGGSVKAFLFEQESLYPYAEEIPSYTDAMIFTPEAITEFKNTTVNYVKATTLETNTAGTYYQDTGIYNDNYTITPIFYDAYNGAKIFAYLGVPANASKDNPVPAMVCVHGGNGQAYRTWVENWAKRGFAAISMDLYGCAPEGEYGWTYNEDQSYKRTPYVGNMNTSPWNASAYSKDGDFRQGAMYQNVANVMYAHNILRGIEGVDTSNIGITGVSWGGVTTTTTIGVDDRFAFAAPIYGCGYLDIGKGGFDTFYKYSDGTINWDPINFAAKADIPILYLNGNNDQNFSALSSSYSVGVAKEGYLSIYNSLTHSQYVAEGLDQVYRFAENMVAGTNPYIKIDSAAIEDDVLTINCTIPDGTTLENVKMYYITDEEYPDITSYSSVNWQTVSEYINNDGVVTISVPSGATYIYAELTDQNGDILCTKILY